MIIVSSFTNKPNILYRGETIAVEIRPLDCLIHSIFSNLRKDVNRLKHVSTVSTYNRPETSEAELKHHGQIEAADQDTSGPNWYEEGEIFEKYAEVKEASSRSWKSSRLCDTAIWAEVTGETLYRVKAD